MSKYVKVDDVMALINTSNRGNCDYFIVDKIEELCMSDETTGEAEIRAKTINDFAERMIIMMPGHRQDIEQIAKQMKGGGDE